MQKLFLILGLTLLYSLGSNAQKSPPNIPHFDETLIHFGAIVGYNQFSSILKVKEPLPEPDKVIGMNNPFQHGFQLGILGDLKLFEYLRLRLLPTISFGDRKFNYNIIDSRGNYITESTNIEAIYLEAPLELKIQTKRWRNFRPYLITGLKYAYDLASLKNKKISEEDQLLRVDNNDWMYTFGTGFDFYLPYFKFGIELKSSFSFNNMHIPEPQKPYSNIIDTYRTKIFYLTFTFE
ncbi:MAG: porin family protein [Bacteroidales bacterium]|jgi:hypothetical protein|nr:porin family protein [Bacteroidales bacterium]MDD4528314.1 porin family protein [Bacteroidales bacterium]MDD4829165.1 porin family protein [Bacteroidales bacterium]